jgi:hypothetical protein
LASWAIDRDIINEEATKIRARFDQERGCKPEKAIRLLRVRIVFGNVLDIFFFGFLYL